MPIAQANTAAWLHKARQDLNRVARCLSEDPPDTEDSLFHSQQSAEKAPKAFLTWNDQPFRKTHDLSALGKQCSDIDRTLIGLMNRLDDLTKYAWIYCYPREPDRAVAA